nr:G-protein coupled receptor 55-like isoform X2 [Geotrypetes seraphini]XP_033813731.1 G-protein coupled receptor 55-like isoform X2 [Geotrypetes seraphini]
MENQGISQQVELFQIIVYIPTFILGLLFNIMALWMVFVKIKKWMESTTYVVTLIIVDTLLLFTLPFKMYAYNWRDNWKLGSMFCSFLESLYFVNMYGSILISMCICVDRYIAIRYPFCSQILRSPKKAMAACFIVCIIVWSGSSVFIYKLHESNNGTGTQCFYGFSNTTWTNTSLVAMLETVFLSSVIIMTFCTANIIVSLRKKIESKTQTSLGNKSLKIVTANLATFVVCFTPFHISIFLYYLVKSNVLSSTLYLPLRTFVQVSLCVANINCFLDAICYYLVFKEFLKSVPQNRLIRGRN